MLALYYAKVELKHDILYLINMCDSKTGTSLSHGLSSQTISKQAQALDIPIIQKGAERSNYEDTFKEVISKLKDEGVTTGIFGDIYLQEHRDWIERVCSEMNINPIFPLWGKKTIDILTSFVDLGFKALTVSVNNNYLPESWLGREIDASFINDISLLANIDPCAENGEYHSFVYDGPIFKEPVNLTKGKKHLSDNHYFLELLP